MNVRAAFGVGAACLLGTAAPFLLQVDTTTGSSGSDLLPTRLTADPLPPPPSPVEEAKRGSAPVRWASKSSTEPAPIAVTILHAACEEGEGRTCRLILSVTNLGDGFISEAVIRPLSDGAPLGDGTRTLSAVEIVPGRGQMVVAAIPLREGDTVTKASLEFEIVKLQRKR